MIFTYMIHDLKINETTQSKDSFLYVCNVMACINKIFDNSQDKTINKIKLVSVLIVFFLVIIIYNIIEESEEVCL